ncbi:MAG: bifunctional hydroxymethylpyrimidine kinase/phosphomethylpyrimidine kinase [Deltaproteobacteria bacterium]|nr:bifunctional hydroxymethylpyrimidine kinase/phosphomethylpyrimidine kinase [Deltaproteobacteria bacterium]
MSIVVVGSVFFDTVETPHGKVEEVIGGAATYFAVAASFFTSVKMVATAGEDFPPHELDFLRARGVDLSGLTLQPGRTGRWVGRYHEDMNVRDTLDLQLNVFADFKPVLPASYRDAQYVFLANIDPRLQSSVLDQLAAPGLVGCDTMNHWIASARPAVEQLLGRVDVLTVNDEEARLLSGERNLVRAARHILQMGPKSVLIKRGEYGVIRFAPDSVFAIPAFPLEEVFDPTGAGDTFAGGFMGELARSGDTSETGLRRAIVYGSVLASFCVEDFSLERLRTLTHEEIERRYRQFVALTDLG